MSYEILAGHITSQYIYVLMWRVPKLRKYRLRHSGSNYYPQSTYVVSVKAAHVRVTPFWLKIWPQRIYIPNCQNDVNVSYDILALNITSTYLYGECQNSLSMSYDILALIDNIMYNCGKVPKWRKWTCALLALVDFIQCVSHYMP
jgi:hypothetical protein